MGAFDDELAALRASELDGNDPMLIDWPMFWARDHSAAEWLVEPIIPAKRSVALFAPAGIGKSLLMLWISAALSTGRPIFGRRGDPTSVLYLDYEMTEDDLHERLEEMGYGPDIDMGHLHYALLPSLPALDQPEGGKAVLELARDCDAKLVVIDTFGRAVHGDENNADTVRAWYRWTGLHLKSEGRSFVRADHAGKDLERGQRGSSAKGDDVDVVWQMTALDGGMFRLEARKRRMGWVPTTVELLRRDDDDLEYTLVTGGGWPARTAETAELLEALDVPLDAGYRKAIDALRGAGHPTRAEVVRAAQKYRRISNERSEIEHLSESATLRTHKQVFDGDAPSDAPIENDDLPGRTHIGTRADAGGGTDGAAPASPIGDAGAAQCASDPSNEDPW